MCRDNEEWYKNWRGTDSTQSRKCMTLKCMILKFEVMHDNEE